MVLDKKARPNAGFTLVELLIASAVMAILVIGLSGHVRAAVEVWQRATAATETLQRERVALDRMSRDLSGAVSVDSRPEAYGTTAGFFPSPVFDSSQLFFYSESTLGSPAGRDVRFVSYACREYNGEPGLWRTELPLYAAVARLEAEPQRLLDSCDGLSLRYPVLGQGEAAGLEWRADWPGTVDRLPAMVEVSIKPAQGRTVRRVFAVPVGRWNPGQSG